MSTTWEKPTENVKIRPRIGGGCWNIWILRTEVVASKYSKYASELALVAVRAVEQASG